MTDYKLYVEKKVYKQIADEEYVSKFFPLLDAMILEEIEPATRYMIFKSTSTEDSLYWLSTGDKEQYKTFKNREIEREFEDAINKNRGKTYTKKRRR